MEQGVLASSPLWRASFSIFKMEEKTRKEGKESIEDILNNLVLIQRQNLPVKRDIQYEQFLESLSSQGNYSAVRKLMKIYNLGVKYMINGRAADENLYFALRGLSKILILKFPNVGERCSKQMDDIYKQNWALLETL